MIRARVIAQHRGQYRLDGGDGELAGQVAGRLRHEAGAASDLPAVGDWVLAEPASDGSLAVIREILPRRSKLSRKVAGERAQEQVVAANVDGVWLINALDQRLSLRRIERYLALAWDSGATPVVLLTKSDLSDDVAGALATVQPVALGVSCFALSAVTGDGLEQLEPLLAPGSTVALLGISGAGKSTLVNRLVGDELLATGALRAADAKGRHTTSHRQLIRLPGGAFLIDTPGVRELALWDAGEGIGDTFAEVEELGAGCRFDDCSHEHEPGCAVQAAVAAGELAVERLEAYRGLRREDRYLERKVDARAAQNEKRRWKAIHASLRHHPKYRR